MTDQQSQNPRRGHHCASTGIGAAAARDPGAKGYRFALLARRVDCIEALAEEIGDGAIAIAIQADVTDRDSLVAAADRVQNELGGRHHAARPLHLRAA